MSGQTGQYTRQYTIRKAPAGYGGCQSGSYYTTNPRIQKIFRYYGLQEGPRNCFQKPRNRTSRPPREAAYSRKAPARQQPSRPQPSPPKSASDGYRVTDREKELLRLTNEMRRQYGRGPVRLNKRLMAASRRHSLYMRNSGRVGHILSGHPDGAYPHHRAHKFGYRGRVGENIAEYARGYTPKQAFDAWVNSPGHFRTMLNPDWKVMGVGDAGSAWTTMFGNEYDNTEVTVGSVSIGPYAPYAPRPYKAYGVPGWDWYSGYAGAMYFPAKAWKRPPDPQKLYDVPIAAKEVQEYCTKLFRPYCDKFPGDTYCNSYRDWCSKYISVS